MPKKAKQGLEGLLEAATQKATQDTRRRSRAAANEKRKASIAEAASELKLKNLPRKEKVVYAARLRFAGYARSEILKMLDCDPSTLSRYSGDPLYKQTMELLQRDAHEKIVGRCAQITQEVCNELLARLRERDEDAFHLLAKAAASHIVKTAMTAPETVPAPRGGEPLPPLLVDASARSLENGNGQHRAATNTN